MVSLQSCSLRAWLAVLSRVLGGAKLTGVAVRGLLMQCLLSQQLCSQQEGAPHCQQTTAALVFAGGELQRFAIAVVAAQAADIYMIDEPSSYLDVRQRLKAAQVKTSQHPWFLLRWSPLIYLFSSRDQGIFTSTHVARPVCIELIMPCCS